MANESMNVRQLECYLNSKMRVTITDDRVFIGIFVCIDKQKNIILAHTEEFRKDEKRLVGLVMIPGKHQVKIEAEDIGELYT